MWDWLDNATLGALLGAAGAFLLVMLTDWWRNRRVARKQLPSLLRQLLVLVDARYKGAIDARDSIEPDPRMQPMGNIGMPFPVERIQRYSELVGDRLTDRQGFALSNITFGMREADRLNAASRDLCGEIDRAQTDMAIGEGSKRVHVPSLRSLLKKQYGEEAVLLDHLRKSIRAYLEGRLNERGGPLASER